MSGWYWLLWAGFTGLNVALLATVRSGLKETQRLLRDLHDGGDL